MTTETLTSADYAWSASVQSSPLPDLCDVAETAAYLRCGRTHVFHLIASGQLASVKVGRKRLVPATVIRAYVESLV